MKLLSDSETITALFVIGMYYVFTDNKGAAEDTFSLALKLCHSRSFGPSNQTYSC